MDRNTSQLFFFLALMGSSACAGRTSGDGERNEQVSEPRTETEETSEPPGTTDQASECADRADCETDDRGDGDDDLVECALGEDCPSNAPVSFDCDAGEWNHDSLESTPCVPHTSCVPGSELVRAGSSTQDTNCRACATGVYCPGDEAPPTACDDGHWDHDLDPATPCRAWGTCEPGSFNVSNGNALNDRSCSPCPSGTFSTADNSDQCNPWADCESGYEEDLAPDSRQDRTCKLSTPTIQLGELVELGSTVSTATTQTGEIVIVGQTEGDSAGTGNAGGTDIFVAKLNSELELLWIQQIGTPIDDEATDVVIDGSGSIFVASGSGLEVTPGLWSHAGRILKLDPAGAIQWDTFVESPNGTVRLNGVALDNQGGVVGVGATTGDVEDGTNQGSYDALVFRLKPNGEFDWTVQYGGNLSDKLLEVVVDQKGDVVVAGETLSQLAPFDDREHFDWFLSKLSPSGELSWTIQEGGQSADHLRALAVDSEDNIYVGGYWRQEQGNDVALQSFSPSGVKIGELTVPVKGQQGLEAISFDPDGNLRIVGWSSVGFWGFEPSDGDELDVFVATLTPDFEVLWSTSFGAGKNDKASDLALGASGQIYVVGTTEGGLGPGGGEAPTAFLTKLIP